MAKILHVRNVADYSRWLGHADRHPLISVIDYSEVSPIRHSLNNYSVYGIFLRDDDLVDLTYGCGKYDYRKGTLICVAPGQIGGKEDNGERVDIKGWAVLFHPDLLHGSALEKDIRKYSFFDYHINEALHMTGEEHDILVSLMRQMKNELENGRDDFQDSILTGYLGLILRFCSRFYQRQFMTRKLANTDVLKRFDALLRDYYENGLQMRQGIPGVQYCADKLCMSTNYFGDLIKKMTGDTARDYIRNFVVQQSKNMLAAGKSVSQTAYDMGFDYPQHFSRMFKNATEMTPKEYCDRRK